MTPKLLDTIATEMVGFVKKALEGRVAPLEAQIKALEGRVLELEAAAAAREVQHADR
jgi:hypothetical protein